MDECVYPSVMWDMPLNGEVSDSYVYEVIDAFLPLYMSLPLTLRPSFKPDASFTKLLTRTSIAILSRMTTQVPTLPDIFPYNATVYLSVWGPGRSAAHLDAYITERKVLIIISLLMSLTVSLLRRR